MPVMLSLSPPPRLSFITQLEGFSFSFFLMLLRLFAFSGSAASWGTQDGEESLLNA